MDLERIRKIKYTYGIKYLIINQLKGTRIDKLNKHNLDDIKELEKKSIEELISILITNQFGK